MTAPDRVAELAQIVAELAHTLAAVGSVVCRLADDDSEEAQIADDAVTDAAGYAREAQALGDAPEAAQGLGQRDPNSDWSGETKTSQPAPAPPSPPSVTYCRRCPMRSDDKREVLMYALWVVLVVALTVFSSSCTIFSNRWAVPHATPLRPCQGVYTYPDSAGTCEPKEGK